MRASHVELSLQGRGGQGGSGSRGTRGAGSGNHSRWGAPFPRSLQGMLDHQPPAAPLLYVLNSSWLAHLTAICFLTGGCCCCC